LEQVVVEQELTLTYRVLILVVVEPVDKSLQVQCF
jgi:hypothetical protein